MNRIIRKTYLLSFYIFMQFFSTNAVASCRINSVAELVTRLKVSHPQIKQNLSSLKVVQESVQVAGQRQNPDIQIEGIKGDSLEGNVKRMNFSVIQPFELGGKRKSKIEYAVNQLAYEQYSFLDKNEDLLIDAVLKVYRQKQINRLIAYYQEAYEVFNEILKIKKNRRTLSPEEQVEKETLFLVASDYLFKVSRLKSEEFKLRTRINYYLGESCTIAKEALLNDLDSQLSISNDLSLKKYSRLLMETSALEVAKSHYNLESAKAYPDLKIGPIYEVEMIGERKYQSIGFALNIELPVFNRNSEAKVMANYKVSETSLSLKNFSEETQLNLETLIQKYFYLKKSFQTLSNREFLEQKHKEIHDLFKRGVVSTALVIESHRQLLEYENTQNEYELDAVETLWNIKKIKGTIF